MEIRKLNVLKNVVYVLKTVKGKISLSDILLSRRREETFLFYLYLVSIVYVGFWLYKECKTLCS
jgi:hypothetical protein